VADETSVHVLSLRRAKELVTLISAYGGRDWLVTTPDGYVDGSPGGCSLVHWRLGEAECPFEQFAQQRHRPDIVARTLQKEPEH
jgi:hypothetical protein